MHFFFLLFQVHAFFQITTRISLARWATTLFDSTKIPKTCSDSDFSDSNDFLDCLNNIGKEKNGREYNWIVLQWIIVAVASIRQDLLLLQRPFALACNPCRIATTLSLRRQKRLLRMHISFVEQKRRDRLQHCTVIPLFRNQCLITLKILTIFATASTFATS